MCFKGFVLASSRHLLSPPHLPTTSTPSPLLPNPPPPQIPSDYMTPITQKQEVHPETSPTRAPAPSVSISSHSPPPRSTKDPTSICMCVCGVCVCVYVWGWVWGRGGAHVCESMYNSNDQQTFMFTILPSSSPIISFPPPLSLFSPPILSLLPTPLLSLLLSLPSSPSPPPLPPLLLSLPSSPSSEPRSEQQH